MVIPARIPPALLCMHFSERLSWNAVLCPEFSRGLTLPGIACTSWHSLLPAVPPAQKTEIQESKKGYVKRRNG